MRVLFLSRWYPYPPDNGSKIRVANLLEGLCEHADVSLISFAAPRQDVTTDIRPAKAPRDITVCRYREFNPRSRRALLGYLQIAPRSVSDTYNVEMDALIRKAVHRGCDVVVASQLSMASYHQSFFGVPAVFDEIELGLFCPDRAGATRSPWTAFRETLTWQKHRRYCARLLEHFRACTVVSQRERDLLTDVAPGYNRVQVVPNCIDVEACRRTVGERQPESLIFVGSFAYWPNYEGIAWFLREVYPLIRSELRGVRLQVTGDPGEHPPLSAPGVIQTGRVSDVHTLVAASALSIVPIRRGGGTRLKILESIANCTPVVTTTKGVEGLSLRSGEHVLIADTASEFARAVIKLIREPEYGRKIAENALLFIKSRYDRNVVVPQFTRLVQAAAVASSN